MRSPAQVGRAELRDQALGLGEVLARAVEVGDAARRGRAAGSPPTQARDDLLGPQLGAAVVRQRLHPRASRCRAAPRHRHTHRPTEDARKNAPVPGAAAARPSRQASKRGELVVEVLPARPCHARPGAPDDLPRAGTGLADKASGGVAQRLCAQPRDRPTGCAPRRTRGSSALRPGHDVVSQQAACTDHPRQRCRRRALIRRHRVPCGDPAGRPPGR